MIAAAIFAVYVILGVLYESFIHPITILLSLPPASMGALLCPMLFGFDLSVIAIIGLIMLVGIVRKNAIHNDRLCPRTSAQRRHVGRGCDLPCCDIALPADHDDDDVGDPRHAADRHGIGSGAELRQPLGVAVVGGLIVSQALTLYTIPVTYVYMDWFGDWIGTFARSRGEARPARGQPQPVPIRGPDRH